ALGAAPLGVGDRGADEVGARPVVELAVGDPDDAADLRPAEPELARRGLHAVEHRLLPGRGGELLRGHHTLDLASARGQAEVQGGSYGNVRLVPWGARVNVLGPTRRRRSLRGAPGRGTPGTARSAPRPLPARRGRRPPRGPLRRRRSAPDRRSGPPARW